MFSGLIIIVDLEGVEPSSKRGSHTLSFERCLVSITLMEIKLIYCTSIKQREHSFRCQIIVQ